MKARLNYFIIVLLSVCHTYHHKDTRESRLALSHAKCEIHLSRILLFAMAMAY